MSKIRKSAQGEECCIRIPGVCNFDPSTTVIAHYRMQPFCGTGIKPPDWMGAYACGRCHDASDGRLRTHYTGLELKLFHLEGVLRSQAKLIENGLLRVEK